MNIIGMNFAGGGKNRFPVSLTSLLFFATFLLAACGDGGGNSSTSNNSTGTGTGTGYSGSTSVAVVTTSNGQSLATNASGLLALAQGISVVNVTALPSAAPKRQVGIARPATQSSGACGGTVTVEINGTNVKDTFADYCQSTANGNTKMNGTIVISGTQASYTTTMNLTFSTTSGGVTTIAKMENYVMTMKASSGAYEATISGKYCDATMGCVTVSTPVTIKGTITNGEYGKPQSGELLMTGSGGGSIRIVYPIGTPTVIASTGTSTTYTGFTMKVPATGQTDCYAPVGSGSTVSCVGTGEDGAYSNINPMSYHDNGNGTVTDNVTGLMWQQGDNFALTPVVLGYGASTLQVAESYCTGLRVGGYSDWRLPSRIELTMLANYSGQTPAINVIFPTIATGYWAATFTPNVDWGPDWAVDFADGRPGSGHSGSEAFFARCVRGQQTTQSFTDNLNGTVTDNVTGLMWQQGDSYTTNNYSGSNPLPMGALTWADALSYCTGLRVGGYSDWRLPNIKELSSVLDDTAAKIAINAIFPTSSNLSPMFRYWSSTVDRYMAPSYYSSSAWVVDFKTLGFGSAQIAYDSMLYARCVRGGTGTSPTPTTFSISGAVTTASSTGLGGSTGLTGVTMALSGTSTATTATDANGSYYFGTLTNGSYTITPTKTGYTFSPASIAQTINGAGTSWVSTNFTATSASPTTFSISGAVTTASSSHTALAGATMALSGTSTATTTTDANGYYVFSSLANGSYIITPTKTGYTFSPASIAQTINGAGTGYSGVNFTATPVSTPYTGPIRKAPDTGQTTCYNSAGTVIACAGTGQDGAYTINPPSYTDNGDSTITDNVTGLMWQKQDDATARVWADAGTYCTSLPLGGQTGWRLPSARELQSIVDYSMLSPSISMTYFPGTQSSSNYWSSTAYANGTPYAWAVYFYDGRVLYLNKTSNWYARCVRGQPTPTQSFTDNGNGTITDNVTTLMWQKQDDATTRTWDAALTYCEGLTLGGYSDWRLPNVKELRSIVDDTVYSPSINATYFPGTLSSYWSSTTYAPSNAWNVFFGDGNVSNYVNKAFTDYARCVRGDAGTVPTTTTFKISGAVTTASSGTALAGVTMALSGTSTATTPTDTNGYYVFSSLANGSYTITPTKTGYTFSPASIAQTINGAGTGYSGVNFTATPVSTPYTGPIRKAPDTGQTTCYNSAGTVIACAGTGQDGAYTINPPSYTDNGDSTITDNVTGLMWQKQDDATTRVWADAGTYCTSLPLGGQTGWRLPSARELQSIVNYSMSNPAINATYFPSTKSQLEGTSGIFGYWSSTPLTYDTTNAWYVNFLAGLNYAIYKSVTNYVRCVRGAQIVPSFNDNGDGTITDNVTGLMWQKQDDGTPKTWANALSYCSGLSLAGQSGWRLPNVKELTSIVDYTVYNPAINTIYFPFTQGSQYWSSTTDVTTTTYAWTVFGGIGAVLGNDIQNKDKTNTYYARCVR